jgi:predicted component of type VI protein secretion system
LEPGFRLQLAQELSEWMEEGGLAPLLASADAPAFAYLDRGVRGVMPLGLEAVRLGAAARAVRALPPLSDAEAARKSMFALEKLARAHAAPDLLVRAAHGACACGLSLGLAEARGRPDVDAARRQLVSALVRLATTTIRGGAPVHAVVGALAAGVTALDAPAG